MGGWYPSGTATPEEIPGPLVNHRKVEEWRGIEVGMTTGEMFAVIAPQLNIVRWQDPTNPEFREVHEYFEDTATGERCIVVIHAYVPEGEDPLTHDATILIVEELWIVED